MARSQEARQVGNTPEHSDRPHIFLVDSLIIRREGLNFTFTQGDQQVLLSRGTFFDSELSELETAQDWYELGFIQFGGYSTPIDLRGTFFEGFEWSFLIGLEYNEATGNFILVIEKKGEDITKYGDRRIDPEHTATIMQEISPARADQLLSLLTNRPLRPIRTT